MPIIDNDKFYDILTEFEKELRKRQEPLGKDFQKVLDDNFWNLLVTDKPKNKEN